MMGLAFIHPALPICLVVYVQKSDFHLINVFCVVIFVKNVLCLVQVVFSDFVLHSSKILLVLTTKVINLRSLLFRRPDQGPDKGGVGAMSRGGTFRGEAFLVKRRYS